MINGKSSDTLIFVYDPDTKRLLMYATGGNKLKLVSVRNTAYDAKIHELNNDDEKGTSVKEIREAVEKEDQRERAREKEREAKEQKEREEKEKKEKEKEKK